METTDHARRFGGIERLYGTGSLARLAAVHVCVIGNQLKGPGSIFRKVGGGGTAETVVSYYSWPVEFSVVAS